MAEEAKAMAKANIRELSQAHDGVVAVTAQSVTMLSDQSTKLQDFCLVVSRVCAHLSPLTPIGVPLIDRLRALPGHVEHVAAKGAFHRSSMALGQMVAHFDEIDASMITEGFTAGRSDEELFSIEDHVHPHARSLMGRVDVKALLTGSWSMASSAGIPPDNA